MKFQLGGKTRRQFSKEVSILYLIKDGIIQVCPNGSNEACSNICPFFVYESDAKKLKISCRTKTIVIKIEGEYNIDEC